MLSYPRKEETEHTMNKGLKIVCGALVAIAAGIGITYAVAGQDIRAAHSRTMGAEVLSSPAGQIEYLVIGQGPPVLLIHGTSGGFVQGRLLAEVLGGPYGYIIPSRFGYLGTPLRADSSPAAQAAAHVELLDALGVRQAVVMGASAGALSAMELAARHPERVSGLLLVSPAAWSPDMEVSTQPISPAVANFVKDVVLKSDFAFWLMVKLARPTLLGFLATPPELEAQATPEEHAYVDGIIDSLLTVSLQGPGLTQDGANHDARQPAALERITAPALIVSAEDDLYQTMPGAAYTASQIRDARLMRVPRGGHLLVGGLAPVWDEIRAALATYAVTG
jgi:2-hydroxy-6-oxonona-2,4-dienedioate hydrolase